MANIYKMLEKYLFSEAEYAIKEFFRPLLIIYRYIFKSDDNHTHGGAQGNDLCKLNPHT